MATPPKIDSARQEAFVGKVLADTSGALVTMLAVLGDRLGLFKDLEEKGPATSAELAARAGINERYAREWLDGMVSAGYLEYDPTGRRFTLPTEHVPALAQEAGPFYFGGAHQMLAGMMAIIDPLTEVFRKGGGVPQSAYSNHMWDGMERFTRGWFDNLLTQQWIPAMPEVKAKLERGVRVADVGCGRGRALIKLAQAFPNARYVGYDAFEPTIARAVASAHAAGVGDRVTFKHLDASKALPEKYDVITTFDVVHDAIDPRGLLRAIRQGLKADGTYVCLDINCSDKLEENSGPLGALFYGFSVFYCMTTSLAGGGAALGTLGFHEPKVQELCMEAGFSSVRRVPLENPFNILYEIKP